MLLLLGDRSLVYAFVDRLRNDLTSIDHQLESSEAAFLASNLGAMLFNLVLLRCYLERPPCDDGTIYQLLKDSTLGTRSIHGTITRHLSIPEAALASMQQLDDEELRDPHLWCTFVHDQPNTVEHDPTLDCTISHPIAFVHTPDGDLFMWPESADPGLTPFPFPHNPHSSLPAIYPTHARPSSQKTQNEQGADNSGRRKTLSEPSSRKRTHGGSGDSVEHQASVHADFPPSKVKIGLTEHSSAEPSGTGLRRSLRVRNRDGNT